MIKVVSLENGRTRNPQHIKDLDLLKMLGILRKQVYKQSQMVVKNSDLIYNAKKNYFTSSDPHHDMLGGGCQVRVVIKNMMGRMENLRTLISGFLGLVILVRWALVTMFLS